MSYKLSEHHLIRIRFVFPSYLIRYSVILLFDVPFLILNLYRQQVYEKIVESLRDKFSAVCGEIKNKLSTRIPRPLAEGDLLVMRKIQLAD